MWDGRGTVDRWRVLAMAVASAAGAAAGHAQAPREGPVGGGHRRGRARASTRRRACCSRPRSTSSTSSTRWSASRATTSSPVGLLAERWETVNPTTWRFNLRKDVKFHDGKALDAEDVKYSIEQYADPKNRRSVYARGHRARRGEGRQHGGPRHRRSRWRPCCSTSRACRSCRGTRGRRRAPRASPSSPVGTGPYRFVEWKRDQQLVLEANPTYWRGVVSPKRLVFRAIRDAEHPRRRAPQRRRRHHRRAARAPARHARRGRDPGGAREGRPDHHLRRST